MPYRREQFINGEIYHVVVKRIEDRPLFIDTDDYYRGIFSIYEFNDTKPVVIRDRRKARAEIKKLNRDPLSVIDNRDHLVEILVFCFMPNHIHLLLRQLKEGGIIKFMNKFGAGYPAYFKQKHGEKRRGYFFQGRFTSVHIKTNEQLKTVFVYVHTNPLSLIEPDWKERGIKNPERAIKFLEDYKWSSYPDYIGKKNFPSVTKREFVLETMDGRKGCKEFVEYWVRYKHEIKRFAELALE
jgi:putative transposase